MVQLRTHNKLMKPNISLVCKKSPCLPSVKTVLGQLPQRKNVPNPNPNPNANSNSNPNRDGNFPLGQLSGHR